MAKREMGTIVLLAMDAHAVIGLRLSKIATGGPGAAKETHRMVAEKSRH